MKRLRDLITKIRRSLGLSNETAAGHPKFIDLAPTDNADEAGVYSDALLYATGNPRVSNIALTGPYGSGKSSIIKSFLKRYPKTVLQISLAAFLPEATAPGGKVTKQEVERSILQQMLYGENANRLPFSRFKRIKSPSRWFLLLSLYAICGAIACWHLFQRRDDIIAGKFFLPLARNNWPSFAWFTIGASFLWLTLNHIYKASFGVSFKSISLKDIEITPAATDKESILNRHLDEIIYFFQSTKYDLVVIEDLDRFDDSDIFVTLREINSLVNANAGVKRTIRFLYALRDDMFVNTDRTKFFEFIIPVIPIINSSNSIDKVLEEEKRLSLDSRLDRQFLREVSRYLNDLRLIKNIFNEYAIYVANLETDGDNVLDATKLLAVLIYKNVFPKDFESLHRGKGNLAEILERHDVFIANGEAEYKRQIDNLERQIDAADRQIPSDVLELRRIYAMALIEKLPAGATHVSLNNQTLVDFPSLARSAALDQILNGSNVIFRNSQGYNQNFNIAKIQSEVDPARTLQEREVEIERRGAEAKNAASKRVRELRAKSAALRSAKFNEIIRLDADGIDGLFNAFGDSGELARFLILEGHLDDTYYQYTSLFHSGRLSPNDNKYLIQIRGFVTPNPGFQIDNPKEVVAAMRDEDFRQSYVLNIRIMDCLLGNPAGYSDQIEKMLEYLSSNFDSCAAFFDAYYAAGAEVPALVARLVKNWPGFVPAILDGPRHLMHVAQIIAHLPAPALETLPSQQPDISEFISTELAPILALGVDFDPSRLVVLGVEIANLKAVEDFPGIVRFLLEEGLYEITIDNVEFVSQSVPGFTDVNALRTQNYTTVLNMGSAALTSRIEAGFADYMRNVLLTLDDNSLESAEAILSIIGRDDVVFDDLSAFLSRQSAVIPSLADVPDRFQALVFQFGRIEASWENCLAFRGGQTFDPDSLSAFLNMAATQAALSDKNISGDEQAAALRGFLVGNNALRDATYRSYVRCLPRRFSKFPEDLDAGKMKILIEEEKIAFSKDNLDVLDAERELQILFVVRNIEQYLKDEASFAFDDDFLEELIGQHIGDAQKLAIIRSMDLTLLPSLPARAGILGPILDRTGATLALDGGAVRAIILNSAPNTVQISLFNRYQSVLSDGEIREILTMLPRVVQR